jgi:hypothetical protein
MKGLQFAYNAAVKLLVKTQYWTDTFSKPSERALSALLLILNA